MDKTIYSERYGAFLRLLRSTRNDSGMQQAELAAKLSATQTFISKCERGQRRVDIVELATWCEAMGTSLSVFSANLEHALSKLQEVKNAGDADPTKVQS